MSEIDVVNRRTREEILRRVASSETCGMVLLVDAGVGAFGCMLGDSFSESELLTILSVIRSGYASLEQRLFGTIVDAIAHRVGPAFERSEIERFVNESANARASVISDQSEIRSRLSIEKPEGGAA